MKVIIGARDLWPTPAIAARILSIIISTDEEIAIRGPVGQPGVSSMTEEMVYVIATKINRPIFVARPSLPEGNSRNWKRDNMLVSRASEVFAFFGPDSAEGGTEHVVAIALRTGKPVIAYAPDNHGELIEVASDEGFTQSAAEYEEHEWH